MIEIKEGFVVVVQTGQVGTVVQAGGGDSWVLLANGDIWVGNPKMMHIPQSQEEIDAAPRDVERFEEREKIKPTKRSREDY